MPESKHHKKGKSHSAWRKARNIRRAQRQAAQAQQKRGMRQAMKIMEEQVADPFSRPLNNPTQTEGTHDYYEDQMGKK